MYAYDEFVSKDQIASYLFIFFLAMECFNFSVIR